MKRTILLVVVAVLALGLVPILAQANHCPGTSPPTHTDVVTIDPTGSGRHVYTAGTNVGTHSNVGWIEVGTVGVQGSTSDGTTAGHLGGPVGTDLLSLKVAGITVVPC